MNSTTKPTPAVSRRRFLAAATATAVAGTSVARTMAAEPAVAAVPDYRIQNGRIRQGVYAWCFNPMPAEQLIRACHRFGVQGMSIGKEHFPLLKQLGMQPAITGGHGFTKGPFARENVDFCVAKLREAIDVAAQFKGCDVITFTGMRAKGTSDEAGSRNCVDCWKQVATQAEKKGVNLVLEMLNTRDSSHPMKGHPGYFGDDVERCIDLIKKVDSPRMKLLFDVYHVQIMNGDIIRRIRQYKDYIGHYHVAGVPGRNEPDDTQEVNFPAVMRAILETGYRGWVCQEFIPTRPDKLASLAAALRLCDV